MLANSIARRLITGTVIPFHIHSVVAQLHQNGELRFAELFDVFYGPISSACFSSFQPKTSLLFYIFGELSCQPSGLFFDIQNFTICHGIFSLNSGRMPSNTAPGIAACRKHLTDLSLTKLFGNSACKIWLRSSCFALGPTSILQTSFPNNFVGPVSNIYSLLRPWTTSLFANSLGWLPRVVAYKRIVQGRCIHPTRWLCFGRGTSSSPGGAGLRCVTQVPPPPIYRRRAGPWGVSVVGSPVHGPIWACVTVTGPCPWHHVRTGAWVSLLMCSLRAEFPQLSTRYDFFHFSPDFCCVTGWIDDVFWYTSPCNHVNSTTLL